MDRSDKLKRTARIWRVAGTISFLIGALLIWERASYNLHDFYAENFDHPTEETLTHYEVGPEQRALLAAAFKKMKVEDYWEAAANLDAMKALGGPAIQLAEWYKTLCMVGLGEKEKALGLLEYCTEQPDFSFKKKEALELLEDY